MEGPEERRVHGAAMEAGKRAYRLAKGVRVRREVFGLVFYKPEGPKLLFLPTGDWLLPEIFLEGIELGRWLKIRFPDRDPRSIHRLESRLLPVLSRLVERGWIVEAMEAS